MAKQRKDYWGPRVPENMTTQRCFMLASRDMEGSKEERENSSATTIKTPARRTTEHGCSALEMDENDENSKIFAITS